MIKKILNRLAWWFFHDHMSRKEAEAKKKEQRKRIAEREHWKRVIEWEEEYKKEAEKRLRTLEVKMLLGVCPYGVSKCSPSCTSYKKGEVIKKGACLYDVSGPSCRLWGSKNG